MENRQDGKGKRKAGDPAADTRQLDMWSAGQAAPVAEVESRIPPQAPEPVSLQKVREHRRRTGSAPTSVKVTVSGTSRHAAERYSNRSLPALTRRQHELLDYLRRRAERGDLPPSLTEICRDLGLSSRGSLHKQIVALVKANLVEAMHGKQRGVRLTPGSLGRPDGEVALLGAIAAGRPIEALTRDESVRLPEWLRSTSDCYALRVRGDSMRDAGILDGDLVGRALKEVTAGAGVEAFVVLADDNEIHVLGALVLERTILGAIKADGAEIDVLFELEPEAEQDALFENAGFHLGVADGTEEDGLEAAQFIDRAVGKDFAGAKVSFAAEIEVVPVEFEAELGGRHFCDLEGLEGHFGTRAVAADDCDIVRFHFIN